MIRLAMLVGLVAAATSCSGPAEKEPPPPVAELSIQEVIALEGKPGSTPALEDATQPAPAPVAGLEGAPGPSPAYGPATAPVYVFVLTDFQCPVCRRIVEPMKYLARRYPKDVRVVLKNNALVSHRDAAAAATAGIAAFRQGKFWGYYDRLFEIFGYDQESLITHAQALGLDAERFKKDLADPSVAAQVKYESAFAGSVDLKSTPGFIVNGVTQMGWGSYAGIKASVDRELARAKPIAASGVPPDRVAYEATRQSGPKGEAMAAALFPPMK
jgi:protein-disulfide isomerase